MQQSSRQFGSVPPAFSSDEAPSFCSRQTPIVPASDDLRVQSMGSLPPAPDAEEHRATSTPSSRPTLASDELYRAIVARESVDDEVLSAAIERATVAPALPTIDLPVLDVVAGEGAAIEPVSPVSSQRRIVARVAFTLLFGGVAALLGYAVEPRLVTLAATVLAR